MLLAGALVATIGIAACSDDESSGGTSVDAGADGTTRRDVGTETDSGENEDAGTKTDGGEEETDASCGPTTTSTSGETCIGFGTSTECPASCGQPYGFVCVGGGPPNLTGCRQYRESALGNGYCCPTNGCVLQPDRAGDCADAGAGKTKRYQCPPTDGGNAEPPAGCVEHGSGPSNLEKFYCCP